jgi:hypothetical protein
MKSLSALYDWLGADHPATGGSHRTEPPNYHLRNLPGEEIHLFIKNIDNTKLIRVVDKKDWATSVSVTGAALACSLIVSAMVGPSCYGMLASRRMEYLHEERTRLQSQLLELKVQEARRLNPQNVEEWAGTQFVPATAEQILYAPPSKEAFASLGVTAKEDR